MPDENKDEKRVKFSVIEETPEESVITETSEEIVKKDLEENNPDTESEPEVKKDEEFLEKPIKKEARIDKTQQDKIPFFVLFLSFLIGLSLGAGLIGGLFYYKSKVSVDPKTANPAPTQTSTPELTETPEATSSASPLSKAEISKYTVQILNGSGISGEATKVEPLIKALGFTTVKTANASRFDYKETEISIKKGVDISVVALIKNALKTYTVKEIETPSTSSDILITVGSLRN